MDLELPEEASWWRGRSLVTWNQTQGSRPLWPSLIVCSSQVPGYCKAKTKPLTQKPGPRTELPSEFGSSNNHTFCQWGGVKSRRWEWAKGHSQRTGGSSGEAPVLGRNLGSRSTLNFGSFRPGSAVTNPTRIQEDSSSIPSLAQWVKGPLLPRAVV